MQVIVVGSVNVDLTAHVSSFPQPGQTILSRSLSTAVGGKGANQAVAAARLGAEVTFVGCRGSDAHGGLITEAFRSSGVDVARLREVPGNSGVALVTVDEDGENCIVVTPGANDALDARWIERTAEEWPPGALVAVQQECPVAAVEATADQARERGARLVLNAAPARSLSPRTLRSADPLVVNESEADFYLGSEGMTEADPAGAARQLLELGPRSVIITVGSAGAYAGEQSDGGPVISHIPGVSATTVDTTGAGDGFIGGVLYSLSLGESLLDACRLGVRVGAYSVTTKGAQSSYPSRDDLPLENPIR